MRCGWDAGVHGTRVGIGLWTMNRVGVRLGHRDEGDGLWVHGDGDGVMGRGWHEDGDGKTDIGWA